MKFNAAGTSDANSAAASLLLDLQVGTVSKFNVTKTGAAYGTLIGSSTATFGVSATTGIGFYSSNRVSVLADGQVAMFFGSSQNIIANGRSLAFESGASGAGDTFITRKNTRIIQLGAADAASPSAQTLTVQSVVGGTPGNIAGQNFTINGSQGVGSGAGGSIIFQVAPAGTLDATTQNALAAALTINSSKQVVFGDGTVSLPSIRGSDDNSGIYFSGNNIRFAIDGQLQYLLSGGGETNLVSTASVRWADGGNLTGSYDLFLARDASNTLTQRNGVNAQTFRVYKTYTDSANYERGVFDWTTTPGTLTIGVQIAGSGAARQGAGGGVHEAAAARASAVGRRRGEASGA
jgi:hypothetical protein